MALKRIQIRRTRWNTLSHPYFIRDPSTFYEDHRNTFRASNMTIIITSKGSRNKGGGGEGGGGPQWHSLKYVNGLKLHEYK